MGFYFKSNNNGNKQKEEDMFIRKRKQTELIMGLWFITVLIYYVADIFFNYFDYYYLNVVSNVD